MTSQHIVLIKSAICEQFHVINLTIIWNLLQIFFVFEEDNTQKTLSSKSIFFMKIHFFKSKFKQKFSDYKCTLYIYLSHSHNSNDVIIENYV